MIERHKEVSNLVFLVQGTNGSHHTDMAEPALNKHSNSDRSCSCAIMDLVSEDTSGNQELSVSLVSSKLAVEDRWKVLMSFNIGLELDDVLDLKGFDELLEELVGNHNSIFLASTEVAESLNLSDSFGE